MGQEPKAESPTQPDWLAVEDFGEIIEAQNTSTAPSRPVGDDVAEASVGEETFIPITRYGSQSLVSQPRRSLRPRRKRQLKWVFVAIILLPVLIIGTIAFAVTRPTPVTVEIAPRQERIHQAFNMRVPVKTLRATSPSYASTRSVSGHVVTSASFASGTVTFYNLARYSQKVAGGTILTAASGKQVKTLAEIIVPPAGGDPFVMGQAPAQVQALLAGQQGNIPARDINGTCSLCDPGLAALNGSPITGGQDAADYTVVLPQDITAAATPLQPQALAAAKEALQQQGQDGEKVIDASLSCKPSVQAQPKAQERATEVTVQVTVTCEEISYSQAQVLLQINQQMQSQNAGLKSLAGYRLVGNPIYEVTSFDHLEEGRALLTVSATSHYVYALTREVVQRAVLSRAGRPWPEVRTALLHLPGVGAVQLRGSDRLPTNTSDITVRILDVS